MASYAPLFANTEAWQWTPNMIWVDSLSLYATPNYYVQQLFSRNRGDAVLPTRLDGVETNSVGAESLYASAVRDEAAGEIILKVVNPGSTATEAKINLAGVANVGASAKVVVLTGENQTDVNSMLAPEKIAPVESTVTNAAKEFTYNFAARSVTVLRLKTQ